MKTPRSRFFIATSLFSLAVGLLGYCVTRPTIHDLGSLSEVFGLLVAVAVLTYGASRVFPEGYERASASNEFHTLLSSKTSIWSGLGRVAVVVSLFLLGQSVDRTIAANVLLLALSAGWGWVVSRAWYINSGSRNA